MKKRCSSFFLYSFISEIIVLFCFVYFVCLFLFFCFVAFLIHTPQIYFLFLVSWCSQRIEKYCFIPKCIEAFFSDRQVEKSIWFGLLYYYFYCCFIFLSQKIAQKGFPSHRELDSPMWIIFYLLNTLCLYSWKHY